MHDRLKMAGQPVFAQHRREPFPLHLGEQRGKRLHRRQIGQAQSRPLINDEGSAVPQLGLAHELPEAIGKSSQDARSQGDGHHAHGGLGESETRLLEVVT